MQQSHMKACKWNDKYGCRHDAQKVLNDSCILGIGLGETFRQECLCLLEDTLAELGYLSSDELGKMLEHLWTVSNG